MIGFSIILIILLIILAVYLFPLRIFYKKNLYFLMLLWVLLPYIGYKVQQYFAYLAIIPSQLEVTWPVSMGSETAIRENCGTAVFKLTDTTIKNIEEKGVRFFDGATQSRGYNGEYHHFTPWKETPLPEKFDDAIYWLSCPFMDLDLLSKISKASRMRGSYYAIKHEAVLMVLPSLGYVVFSHDG